MRNTTDRRRLPALETLEERGLLSTTIGLPWSDPGHLTLSFAPDGTPDGGAPSALYQTLGSGPTAATWETTLLKAFQSWAVQSNINIGLVADDGAPVGLPGPPQGKTGQGDIRISARPLDSSTLAQTVPNDLLGTWSGNVVFNSNASFGDGTNGTQDLFGAALHEAGHIFGLPDNTTDTSSVMYDVDLPGRTGPSAADIQALQSIYGVRQPDAYEGKNGNDTFWDATPLASLSTPGDLTAPANGAVTVAQADITTLTDRDTYVFTGPMKAGEPFVVSLRASGLSLLTARLTVFDALGQPVATAVTTDPMNNDLTVTLPSNTLPGATFYARVESGQADVFGIGSYRIAAGRPALVSAATAVPPPCTNIDLPGNGQNNQPGKATTLRATAPPDDPRWSVLTSAEIASPTDVDYYRFQTASTAAPVLLVNVSSTRSDGLTPRIDVFDQNGNPVPSQILYQDADTDTVQLTTATPNTWYIVRVSPLDPSGAHATGNYVLGIDQRTTAVSLAPIASGTLQGDQNQDFRTLTVASGRLFHFDLSGNSSSSGAVAGAVDPVAVKLCIYDSQDQPVYSLRALDGSTPATGDVWLGTGTYTLRIIAATKSGRLLPQFSYNLLGLVRSDPIGPSPVDPTLSPIGPTPTSPPTDPYQVTQPSPTYTLGVLSAVDTFSNPWQ